MDVVDGGSRFGVKGSNEISEGLSAVYRFEHKLDSTNASLYSFSCKDVAGNIAVKNCKLSGGGRLAYVGLSGGFGTITAGQIWNAAYNHVGAITDSYWFYGNSETGYRHGNAVSYSVSSGAMSMQLDAVMENKGDTDTNDVDKVEFGISMNIADVGTIAFAHIDEADVKASNFLAVSTDIVGYSTHLGWAQHKDDMMSTMGDGATKATLEDNTLFAGVGGPLGDTGVSFAFQVRSKEVESKGEDASVTTKTNPWLVNVTRSMGGGSLLILEHGNSDAGGKHDSATKLVLKVDF